MAFNPTKFAFTEESLPTEGFREVDLDPTPSQQGLPGFTEENLPGTPSQAGQVDPAVIEFVKGATDAASDETLADVPKTLQDPDSINLLLNKAKTDASDEGGFTDSLTGSEKIALGMLAILPVIGGFLGGEEGALVGIGAGGQGLVAGGRQAAKQQVATQKQLSAALKERNIDRRDVTKRQVSLQKDWEKNRARQKFDEINQAAQKVIVAASKSKSGIADTTAIIAFMKLLDPGSVVREGEQTILENAQGTFRRLSTLTNKFTSGKRLAPEALAEMKELTRDLVDIHISEMGARVEEIRAVAVSQGVNPDIVIRPDFMKKIEARLAKSFAASGISQVQAVDESEAGIKTFLQQVQESGDNNEIIIKTKFGNFRKLPNGKLQKIN